MGQVSIISGRKFTGLPGRIAVLCLFFMAGATAARQVVQPDGFGMAQDVPPAHVAQEGGVSLQQAIQMAQRQHRGRVLRAETKTRNGRRVHEIRILGDDGRVRTVRIDAQGGGRP